jgi:hypothetical protein
MEWCDEDELMDMEYYDISLIHPMFNRDGYYYDRHKKFCWFEVNGKAYHNKDLANSFCYRMNNGQEEYILPDSEARAMRAVLKTSRDYAVKQVLQARLRKHDDAVELRDTGRRARVGRMRFDKEYAQTP